MKLITMGVEIKTSHVSPLRISCVARNRSPPQPRVAPQNSGRDAIAVSLRLSRSLE